MATQITHRHLVVGLQGSGKTTFAAALWHILDSRDVPTKLKKGKHRGEFRYLEEIAKTWAEGWEIGRTNTERSELIRINLVDEVGGGETALEFTDLSGESYERCFATRTCQASFGELIEATDGILLFVSANRKEDSLTILKMLGEFPELGTDQHEPAKTREVAWDAAKAPQQVQIVDLLQTFVAPPFPRRLQKIAVIISAWDLVRNVSPEAWLEEKMPLLDQFLRANDWISFRVYGISAQGGRVPNKEIPTAAANDRDKLLKVAKASTRIRVEGFGAEKHDLTDPLAWLSGTATDEKRG